MANLSPPPKPFPRRTVRRPVSQ